FALHTSYPTPHSTFLFTTPPLSNISTLSLHDALPIWLNDSTTAISSTQRDNIVTALTNLTTAQPMLNKAELVTRLAADPSVTILDRKSTRLNSSHVAISYAVFCLKKKTTQHYTLARFC